MHRVPQHLGRDPRLGDALFGMARTDEDASGGGVLEAIEELASDAEAGRDHATRVAECTPSRITSTVRFTMSCPAGEGQPQRM